MVWPGSIPLFGLAAQFMAVRAIQVRLLPLHSLVAGVAQAQLPWTLPVAAAPVLVEQRSHAPVAEFQMYPATHMHSPIQVGVAEASALDTDAQFNAALTGTVSSDNKTADMTITLEKILPFREEPMLVDLIIVSR